MRKRWSDWAFAAPALALIAAVNLVPIGQTVWLSGKFDRLPYDSLLRASLWNTALFTSISVSLELVLGLAMALALWRPFRGRGLVRAAVLVPWALPSAVMAMGWRLIYNPDSGVLGDLVYKLGLSSTPNIPWLASPGFAMGACILADVWKTAPYMALLLMAGLATIPEELYEAASIDGAGPLKRFAFITLPLLAPTIALAVVFRAIQAFGCFELIWVLTGGGPGNRTKLIALYVYENVFRYRDMAYGCALTLVMAACLVLMAAAVFRLARRREA